MGYATIYRRQLVRLVAYLQQLERFVGVLLMAVASVITGTYLGVQFQLIIECRKRCQPQYRNFIGCYDQSGRFRQNDQQIGDIRIYDRALTADEVLKNYNARKSAYGL
jgi:hypothetical protein